MASPWIQAHMNWIELIHENDDTEDTHVELVDVLSPTLPNIDTLLDSHSEQVKTPAYPVQ